VLRANCGPVLVSFEFRDSILAIIQFLWGSRLHFSGIFLKGDFFYKSFYIKLRAQNSSLFF
jgi:hypothetical protein